MAEKPDKTDRADKMEKSEKDRGIRVYELAKELKLDSRRLIDLLHRLQVENIRNHMSTVEPGPERIVRDIMQGKLPPTGAATAPSTSGGPETASPGANAPVTPDTEASPPAAPSSAVPTVRTSVGPAQRPGARVPGDRRGPPPAAGHPRPGRGAAVRTGPPMGGGPGRPSGPGNASGAAGRPRPGTGRPGGGPPAPAARGKDQPNRRAAAGGGKDRRGGRPGGVGHGRRWQDDDFRGRSRRPKAMAKPSSMPPVNRRVVVAGSVSVKDLADQLGVKAGDLIRRLMDLGVMATLNHELDRDTAVIVAGEFGARVEERATQEEREGVIIAGGEDQDEDLVARPPVITVMGHVDHGKTSLLDHIRSTRVTAQEAGGITQHIGASVVEWQENRLVFLDTPGHEAFTAMRARGAQVTDLAVLVVAANDGVMPQTVEAINHARAANVPVVVAINKIDLEDANPERVKQGLTEHQLVPEEWGGDTIMVPVSARTGEGMDRLLQSLVAQAEVLELSANPDRAGQGIIIEAQLDRGRGPVATVLVKRGTLKVGDAFVSGHVWGRVRALINDRGERVERAGPSMPVEVLGFAEVPGAGDDFIVLSDDKQAHEIADARRQRRRDKETAAIVSHGVSLDEFYQRLQDSEVRDLNLVVKADVQGSAEALAESLGKIAHEEARVRILHTGVGAVTESDVMLASASHAIVVGFGVGTDGKARRLAEQEHVDIRMYRVIYDAIDDVRQALTGLLSPKFQEVIVGRAEVREVFKVPKIGAVAGSYVTEGKVARGGQVRVLRDGKVVHEGPIASLRRFKDDVREVATGYECGIGLERFNDIKVGDHFEVFAQEEVPTSQAG